MKKLSLILVVAAIFSLTACQKDWDQISEDNQITEEVASMSDMIVSSEFNWKTTKDINVNFTGLDKDDVILIKSLDGDIYQKALVKSGINYSTKITIPTYADEISVTYKGSPINIPIADNNEITHNFI